MVVVVVEWWGVVPLNKLNYNNVSGNTCIKCQSYELDTFYISIKVSITNTNSVVFMCIHHTFDTDTISTVSYIFMLCINLRHSSQCPLYTKLTFPVPPDAKISYKSVERKKPAHQEFHLFSFS